MLAQKISVCGNLFSKNFCARDSNRAENFLSSSRVVNATTVVQEKRFGSAQIHPEIFPAANFFLPSFICSLEFSFASGIAIQARISRWGDFCIPEENNTAESHPAVLRRWSDSAY